MGNPSERTPLSLRDIPPFRGNFRHAPANVSPCKGRCRLRRQERFMQNEVPPHTPLSLRDIPRVVAKSVNSVSAFGAKGFVHFLAPPLPIEPANAGLRRGPQLGELSARTCKRLPCKGRRLHNVTLCRMKTNSFVISPKICPFLLGISTILRLVIDGAPWSR